MNKSLSLSLLALISSVMISNSSAYAIAKASPAPSSGGSGGSDPCADVVNMCADEVAGFAAQYSGEIKQANDVLYQENVDLKNLTKQYADEIQGLEEVIVNLEDSCDSGTDTGSTDPEISFEVIKAKLAKVALTPRQSKELKRIIKLQLNRRRS